MATCEYRKHRKGKRSCPALIGMICSPCCGQHRLRDIDCPENCVHLGGLAVARGATRPAFTEADLDGAWDKLHAYAEKARDFRNDALPRLLELTRWEFDLATGYLYYGHRDAGGRRLVDLFIAACGRDLPRGEIAAAVALRDAWASLFEIVSVHSGISLELRDLRSGELHRVREFSASAQRQPGDVIFAWVMAWADYLELTGLACVVPRQHRERVSSSLDAELAAVRARWPGTPDRELVGATAWVVADAMQAADRDDLAWQPELSTAATLGSPSRITMDDSEAPDDLTRAGEVTTYVAEQAPDPDAWMAIDESLRLTAIEAHHRALGVTVPPMHALVHLVVENQLAAREPPEAGATLDRLVAEELGRHEAIHAIGSVVATAVWDVLRREAPVDRDAMRRALADLRARDWHAEPAAARSPVPIPSTAFHRSRTR
jgi:hypothetical protein